MGMTNDFEAAIMEGSTWIRVGTAMCGHAVGAFQVLDALKAELQKRGIAANVDEVGCLGICFAEPLVDILKPGKPRLFFGNVTPEDVPGIVDAYLVRDMVPSDSTALQILKVIGYLGETPIEGVPNLAELPGMKMQPTRALFRPSLEPVAQTPGQSA